MAAESRSRLPDASISAASASLTVNWEESKLRDRCLRET